MTQTTATASEGDELEDALGAGVFRDLFTWTGDAIVVADAEGRYLDANHAATVLLGYDREELLRLSVSDVVARQPEWTVAEYARFQHEGYWRGEIEVRRKDGALLPVEALATVAPLPTGTVYIAALRDMREHTRLKAELAVRARQQAVVADLGRRALTEVNLDALVNEVVAAVAATLEVEYSKVLELLPGGEALRLRAGVGWREGLVGEAMVGAGADSQAGYTLLSDEPVIVADLRMETRFGGPPLLHEHGVVSGLSAIIRGRERPFGVLGAHTKTRRDFTPDDVLFLRAVANVLAAAIERQHLEDQAREDRFRVLVQHAADMVSIVAEDASIQYVSPGVKTVLGYTPAELLSAPRGDLVHPEDQARSQANFAAALAEPGVRPPIEVRVRHRDGSWRWIETRLTNLLTEPAVCGIVVNARDVTERKEAEAARERDQEFLTAVLEHIEDGIVACNADGVLTLFNRATREFHGLSEEPILAEQWAEHYDLYQVDGTTRMGAEEVPLFRALHGERVRNVELVIAPKDGPRRTVLVSGQALVDARGTKLGAVVSMHDVTERTAAAARLTHQATHDPLTDLPNRTLFLDHLARALSALEQRSSASIAVLFLDLDGFKVINDALGHAVGDELLITIGWRLREHLRPEAMLARFGGDEFAVLLEHIADDQETAGVAQDLIDALRVPFTVHGQETYVTTGIGIALSTRRGTSASDLLRDADTALYQAKAAGPGSYAVFQPRMRAAVLARLARQGELRQALEQGELRLRYQPKVELATGQVVGLEALVRWEHPELGLLLPAEFIGLAEETGLVVPLGQWVLREACRQAQAWPDPYPGIALQVCVNIAARQLGKEDIVAEVAEALAASGLAPRRLVLEITESTAMRGREVERRLRELRQLGVGLAIDDFGTGHSSLDRLSRLPVNFLKVDRSFVAKLGRDRSGLAVLRAVTTLAHDLGMEVTAEGIETITQVEQLRALGVGHGQGYYFARPMADGEIAALLARASLLPEGTGAEDRLAIGAESPRRHGSHIASISANSAQDRR